jgi:hypothetical protein
MPRLYAAALLILVALAIAGCGSNSYDAGKIESFLSKSQEGKVRGLKLGAATCPKDVKLTEGVTFRCTLRIAGVDAPYKVRLTHVDADKVTITAEPAKALISTRAAVDFVSGRLNPSVAKRATVACAKPGVQVIVAAPGTQVGCVVAVDGKQLQAVLVVDDTSGHIHLKR